MNAPVLKVNPLFLCQDLMIELGRVELAMGELRDHAVETIDAAAIEQLQARRNDLSEALHRLAA